MISYVFSVLLILNSGLVFFNLWYVYRLYEYFKNSIMTIEKRNEEIHSALLIVVKVLMKLASKEAQDEGLL